MGGSVLFPDILAQRARFSISCGIGTLSIIGSGSGAYQKLRYYQNQLITFGMGSAAFSSFCPDLVFFFMYLAYFS